jgi:hypothetical protein
MSSPFSDGEEEEEIASLTRRGSPYTTAVAKQSKTLVGDDRRALSPVYGAHGDDSWATTLDEVLKFRARGEGGGYHHAQSNTTYQSLPQHQIGIVLQRLAVQSNALYQLTLVCDIECDPGMVTPELSVRVHNLRSTWSKTFPQHITQKHGAWMARFVVPAGVSMLHIEVLFDVSTLWKRNQCRAIMRTAQCHLQVVDGFTQLERNWVAPVVSEKDVTGELAVRSSSSGGWSSLHRMVSHVYVLRHPRVTWAASRAMQRNLTNHGVRFYLIGGGDNAGLLLEQTCCSHASRCNRCFYHDSSVWAQWNARLSCTMKAAVDVHAASRSEQTSDAAQDARVLRQRLQEATLHARAGGAQRVLFLTDALQLADATWEDGIQMHLSAEPDTWACLLFDTTTTTIAGSPASPTTTATSPTLALTSSVIVSSTSTSLFVPLESTSVASSLTHFPHAFAIGSRDALARLASRLVIDGNDAPLDAEFFASLRVALEWHPSLFSLAAVEPEHVAAASAASAVSLAMIQVLLPVEIGSATTLRGLYRLVQAYIEQDCVAWTLVILLARDHPLVMQEGLDAALIRQWCGTTTTTTTTTDESVCARVRVQWIAQQTDLVSSLHGYANALKCNSEPPAPFLLLARCGYLPLPHQIRTLLEVTRAMSSSDQLFIHTGPGRGMTRVCGPSTSLKHTLFGATPTLASAIANAPVEGDIDTLLQGIFTQAQPNNLPRVIAHTLSCADPIVDSAQ